MSRKLPQSIKRVLTIKDRCKCCEGVVNKNILFRVYKTKKPSLDLKMECLCISRTITLEDSSYIPMVLSRWGEEQIL